LSARKLCRSVAEKTRRSCQPLCAGRDGIPGRRTYALNMRGMPLWRACLSFRLNSSIEPHHVWETLMAAINLKGMDVDALLALRTDIDKRLSKKRSELEKQLSRLRAESGQAAGISRAVFDSESIAGLESHRRRCCAAPRVGRAGDRLQPGPSRN